MTEQTKNELDNLIDNLSDYCNSSDNRAKRLLSYLLHYFSSETDADPDGQNEEGRIASDISWILNKPSKF